VEGRQEAANRGLLTGNGPDGGLASNGKNVIMWGLPGKLEPAYLKSYLKRFTLSGKTGEEEITKLELGSAVNALSSRHLVRCISVSEAHRLVRMMHMTYYNQPLYEEKYLVRARVIY